MSNKLSYNLPYLIQYEQKGNFSVGIGFLFIGIIGEIFSLYSFIIIIQSTSFGESSIILDLISNGSFPLAFFISSFGALCLVYACKEIFVVQGWKFSTNAVSKDSFASKYWKFIFFKSELLIELENIIHFTIRTIYYDELKINYRKRLELAYKNGTSSVEEKFTLIPEKNEKLQLEIMNLVKNCNKVLQKEIPIMYKESV